MKKAINLLILLFATATFFPAIAQNYKSNDILGSWLNEDKDAHILIYEEGGKYFGKLSWLKNPVDEETGEPKKDKENPDEALRERTLKGLVILKNFEYDGDGEWDEGSIYDPKNGKTYSCYMELKSMDKLKIRGYIGISLLGRTSYWTRVKNK